MNNSSKIDNATILDDTPILNIPTQQNTNTQDHTNLEIHRLFYILGLLLMILAYIGPYLYFKYYKKKNFLPGSNMGGVKHAI
jgi:hypothetical protein